MPSFSLKDQEFTTYTESNASSYPRDYIFLDGLVLECAGIGTKKTAAIPFR